MLDVVVVLAGPNTTCLAVFLIFSLGRGSQPRGKQMFDTENLPEWFCRKILSRGGPGQKGAGKKRKIGEPLPVRLPTQSNKN